MAVSPISMALPEAREGMSVMALASANSSSAHFLGAKLAAMPRKAQHSAAPTTLTISVLLMMYRHHDRHWMKTLFTILSLCSRCIASNFASISHLLPLLKQLLLLLCLRLQWVQLCRLLSQRVACHKGEKRHQAWLILGGFLNNDNINNIGAFQS